MSDLKFTEIKAIIVTPITKGDNFYGYRYTYPDGKVKVMMLNKPTRSLMTPETLPSTTLNSIVRREQSSLPITNQLIGGNLPLECFFPPEIGQLGIPYAKVFRDDIKNPYMYVKEVIFDTSEIKRYWLAKYVDSKYAKLMVRDGTAFCVTEVKEGNYAIVIKIGYTKGYITNSMTYLIENYNNNKLFIWGYDGELKMDETIIIRILYKASMYDNYTIDLQVINFKSRSIIGDWDIYGILTYITKGNLLTNVLYVSQNDDYSSLNVARIAIDNDLITSISAFGSYNFAIRSGMKFTQYLDLLPYGKNLLSLFETRTGILRQTSMLESQGIGKFGEYVNFRDLLSDEQKYAPLVTNITRLPIVNRFAKHIQLFEYAVSFNSFITPQGKREGPVYIGNDDQPIQLEWTYWAEGKEMTFDQYLSHIRKRVADYSQMFSAVTGSSQINPLLNIVAAYTDNPFSDLLNYLKSIRERDPIIMQQVNTIIDELNISNTVGNK